VASEDTRDQINAELKAALKEALKRIAALEAENKKLRAKLNMNSSNSSRPPSSDPPWTSINKNQAKRDRKKRRRGGQKGHKGRNRELLPQDRVDHIDVCKPARCKECGKKLRRDDPEPQRHQVWDLRDFASFVTEYKLHALDCTCGARTRASLPEGVPQGQIGPKLIALIALLTGKYRLSKRAIPELLYDLLGVTFSVGTIANVEQLVSDALAAQVEEAEEEAEQYVREQSVVYADETGWREKNKRAWLWVAVTAMVVVFKVDRSRASDVARKMLGKSYRGVLVSDQWGGYSWVNQRRRQLCWAHLLRKFKGWEDRGGVAAELGQGLGDLARKMFAYWYQTRDGTMSRWKLRRVMKKEVIEPFEELLLMGGFCGESSLENSCCNLYLMSQALWTFVRVEGVEPTNNTAEQSLRHAVIWRKTSFGTQSEKGSRFAERILTVVMTLRRQKRPVLQHLVESCEAHLRGAPSPFLLPQAAHALPRTSVRWPERLRKN